LVTIVMLETEARHGELLIDHVNTEVPTVSPVIVVVGLLGDVIVPAPETFTQSPVPTAGTFPAIVVLGVETQTV
jgi:hypothetical protein